jgi:hypothetical protein
MYFSYSEDKSTKSAILLMALETALLIADQLATISDFVVVCTRYLLR